MGGKMNLNPLKKDDNTDALVKALEDANSAGTSTPDSSTQVAAVPPAPNDSIVSSTDPSVIASDPQVMNGDNPLLNPDPAPVAAPDFTVPAPEVSEEKKSDDTDSNAGIAFTGNDLPEGLSSDADAHLPKPPVSDDDSDDLDDVKKGALTALRPLIEKLDLEPADKFEKYLMMLRASDDPTLIKPAYDAAVAIEGEKEKAQALLDVINEINYITANK